MKFEMTTNEFKSFCAQLAVGETAAHRVDSLEIELSEIRSERDDAQGDRNYLQRRLDAAQSDNDSLVTAREIVSRELRELKLEVLRLQDQLIPFKKERHLSKIFQAFTTGQKIYAIKELRELYRLGLREAKDIVEGVSPKDGTVAPEIYRELSELALIFQEYHTAPTDVQRERLRPFVKVETSVEITSILIGNFQLPEEIEPNSSTD